jgi:serine/threonine-protein kinase
LAQQVVDAFPEFDVQLPELGQGTFKVAYKCAYNGHEVVLKLVKEGLGVEEDEDPQIVLPARLHRELRAMKEIASPRIVPILTGPDVREIGSSRHVWYLEPYYAGGTLQDRAAGPASLKETVSLCDALLEGVDALWTQASLVHRDIKPANIAFDEAGQPVLLDLGIAYHPNATPLTNAFAASPRTDAYAAPEQFAIRRIAPIDARTDLFLVGVVTFEVYTGIHPFRVFDDPEGYLGRLMQGSLDEGALEAQPNAESFKRVLKRLLRPMPNQRYRTPSLARRALGEAIA